MLARLKLMWRERRRMVLAFVLALCLTLFLATRSVVSLIYWTSHQDAAIEGWMTLGYVAHSYDVPREVLAEALGMEAASRRRVSLAMLAAEKGVPLSRLEADLAAAIARVRAEND